LHIYNLTPKGTSHSVKEVLQRCPLCWGERREERQLTLQAFGGNVMTAHVAPSLALIIT
jgi:hypothetical protein